MFQISKPEAFTCEFHAQTSLIFKAFVIISVSMEIWEHSDYGMFAMLSCFMLGTRQHPVRDAFIQKCVFICTIEYVYHVYKAV